MPSSFTFAPDSLSPELLRAARWIEANARDVALCSMRECARRAGLAPSTLTRLARALGYPNYEVFKQFHQENLPASPGFADRARRLQSRARARTGWLDQLTQAQQANTASAIELNQADSIEQAASAILAARQVFFLGMRSVHGLAFHLHYCHSMLTPNGVLLHGAAGTLSDQLSRITPDDLLVAISIAPYARETVEAVAEASAHGTPVLALTDSRLSPIATGATQTLLFRSESPSYFHSMTGALALTEALTAAVAVRGRSRTLNHLLQFQQRLERQSAYWEKPSNKNMPAARGRQPPHRRGAAKRPVLPT